MYIASLLSSWLFLPFFVPVSAKIIDFEVNTYTSKKGQKQDLITATEIIVAITITVAITIITILFGISIGIGIGISIVLGIRIGNGYSEKKTNSCVTTLLQ